MSELIPLLFKDTYLDQKIDLLQRRLKSPPFDTFVMPYTFQRHLVKHCLEKAPIGSLVTKLMQHLDLPQKNIDIVVTVDYLSSKFSSSGAAGQYISAHRGRNEIRLHLLHDYSYHTIVAIACHEVTHHYLTQKGIRIQPDSENEKLTDVAAVYLGFGNYIYDGYTPDKMVYDRKVKVYPFMIGYSQKTQTSKLGYLDIHQVSYVIKKTDRMRKQWKKHLEKQAELQNHTVREEHRTNDGGKEADGSTNIDRLTEMVAEADKLYSANRNLVSRLMKEKTAGLSMEAFKMLQQNILTLESGELSHAIQRFQTCIQSALTAQSMESVCTQLDALMQRLGMWNDTYQQYL